MADISTTETATTQTPKKATKAAGKTADAFATSSLPKFDIPTGEVPAAFREIAEKSVAQAQAGYAKLKAAAEETSEVIEDTYETARAGILEFNVKALDAFKANTDAAFGFAKELIAAKTFAEVIELQTAFARKSFETLSAQAKDLQETAQKVATETAAPAKSAAEKAISEFKAA